jgi:hypothetical protein
MRFHGGFLWQDWVFNCGFAGDFDVTVFPGDFVFIMFDFAGGAGAKCAL